MSRGLIQLRWGGWLLLLTVVVVFLDQASKQWVVENILPGQRIKVLPLFDITLAFNRGAAFSLLSDAGGWQRGLFTAISSVVSLVLFFWLLTLDKKQWLLACALALVLGGALGNLWDRVQLGYVVDFVLVYIDPLVLSYFDKEHPFPVFNVADSSIFIGAVLILLDGFFDNKDEDSSIV